MGSMNSLLYACGTDDNKKETTHIYACVTDAAVGAARRPVELTRRAPLHAHCDGVDVNVLIERGAEVIVIHLRVLR